MNEQPTSATYDAGWRLSNLMKPYDTPSVPTLSATYYDTERPFRYLVQQREQATNADVRVSLQFYDGLGRQLQTKAESTNAGAISQVVTDQRFDGLGRTVSATQPRYVDGTSGFYSYVPTPTSGLRWTTTQYDLQGRVSRVTAPDASATTTQYGLFSDGLAWQSTINARRHRTETRQDSVGRRMSVVEFSGDCGNWGYSCGGATTTPWAAYATTSYTYSPLDLLTQTTDAKSNSTTLRYDSLGRKVGMTDPDMGTWSYGYDANGNLTAQTDAKAQTLSFAYDALDRLTNVSGSSILDRSFLYDQPGHGAGIGRRTGMFTAQTSTSWAYSARGQVTAAVHDVGGYTRLFGWSYDSAERVTSVTYPTAGTLGVETVSYGYDAGWRQAYLCSSFGGCYAGEATYSALDQPTQWVLGNSLRQTWSYANSLARLDRLRVGTASVLGSRFDRSYGYDANGNLGTITNQLASQSWSYQYDHRDRLTFSGGGGVVDETVSYDSLGNLTQRSSSQGSQAYSYGATWNGTGAGPHQVRSISGVPYTYDANGNLTSRPGRSYAWNGLNQPTTIGGSGMLDETYQYNADGARVRVATSQATTLVLEGIWEEVVGGAVKSSYTLNGTAVAVRETSGSTSTISYLHGDHLGSVSLVTDGAQAVASSQEFDAWGKVRSGGVSQTKRNYTGQYLDGSGLLYYNARYYDPAIGRFISADTVVPGNAAGGMDGVAVKPLTVGFHETQFLGKLNRENQAGFWFQLSSEARQQAGSPWGPSNPQALNRYSYVLNNPLRYTDPTGHVANGGDAENGYETVCRNTAGRTGACNTDTGYLPVRNDKGGHYMKVWVTVDGRRQTKYVYSNEQSFIDFQRDIDAMDEAAADATVAVGGTQVAIGGAAAACIGAPVAGCIVGAVVVMAGGGGAAAFYIKAYYDARSAAQSNFRFIKSVHPRPGGGGPGIR